MQNTSGDINMQIDETTSALSGGLTSIPLSAASAVVNKWQSTLQGTGDIDLQSIATDLGSLGTQLSSGSLDAAKVGELLSGLSEKVAMVAAGQSGVVSTSLTGLSTALSSAGSQLAS